MKKLIILIILLLFWDITYATDCSFWLCNVHTEIIWNTSEDWKNVIVNLIKYFLWFLAIIWLIFTLKWWFHIMTAAWDDDKLKKWRKTIIFALIWVFIVIIAYFFVRVGFDLWENSIK